MKIFNAKGEGQGSCRMCSDKGIWNRMWMFELYIIEGIDGCYCGKCINEMCKFSELIDALDLGVVCGLQTIGEALLNVKMHAAQIFNYDEIRYKLNRLYAERNILFSCAQDITEDSSCEDVLEWIRAHNDICIKNMNIEKEI